MQQVDNVPLMKAMLELQTQVMALEAENRTLKERLSLREQLVFRHNTYWRGEEGPFCSRCWDAEALLVRIHRPKEITPYCPKCRTGVAVPDQPEAKG